MSISPGDDRREELLLVLEVLVDGLLRHRGRARRPRPWSCRRTLGGGRPPGRPRGSPGACGPSGLGRRPRRMASVRGDAMRHGRQEYLTVQYSQTGTVPSSSNRAGRSPMFEPRDVGGRDHGSPSTASARGRRSSIVSGMFCDRQRTRPLAEALARHGRVVNYDRRGRGESGDTAPYAVEREVEDLAALIAVVGGEAAVYGHSSGAGLALRPRRAACRSPAWSCTSRPTAPTTRRARAAPGPSPSGSGPPSPRVDGPTPSPSSWPTRACPPSWSTP